VAADPIEGEEHGCLGGFEECQPLLGIGKIGIRWPRECTKGTIRFLMDVWEIRIENYSYDVAGCEDMMCVLCGGGGLCVCVCTSSKNCMWGRIV
jgi:hypothetical protein